MFEHPIMIIVELNTMWRIELSFPFLRIFKVIRNDILFLYYTRDLVHEICVWGGRDSLSLVGTLLQYGTAHP